MPKYSSCRLCEDYHPSYEDREKGFCCRVSDVAGDVFFAYTTPEFFCHFENGPMRTISEKEADKNFQKAKEEYKERSAIRERALENFSKLIVWKDPFDSKKS